jgi:hypothetical protein
MISYAAVILFCFLSFLLGITVSSMYWNVHPASLPHPIGKGSGTECDGNTGTPLTLAEKQEIAELLDLGFTAEEVRGLIGDDIAELRTAPRRK